MGNERENKRKNKGKEKIQKSEEKRKTIDTVNGKKVENNSSVDPI